MTRTSKQKTRSKGMPPDVEAPPTAAIKDKVMLAVRIETIDSRTGLAALWREFTEPDPAAVTIGGGTKQPRGSLWHALRQLTDVDLVGRAAGDTFEHTYELPWGPRDAAKVRTFTGTEMTDLLACWGVASWREVTLGHGVSNAWASGQVIAVDEQKIVLDANGHAGNHLRVTGRLVAIKRTPARRSRS